MSPVVNNMYRNVCKLLHNQYKKHQIILRIKDALIEMFGLPSRVDFFEGKIFFPAKMSNKLIGSSYFTSS